ncbi:unnamed protein product [Rotaria socialis]|uniref:PLAT domain-containing protein n=1 Tax=Rotaria socialis TaxID=392032 RepID=A0A820U9M9_9BILA|nr:unnamed protein product [Rotaria socialis]
MSSTIVLSSKSSSKTSTVLSTRQFLVRTNTSSSDINSDENVIMLRILDDMHHVSEEIILRKSESQTKSVENKNIDIFHVRTQQELGETIRKLKLHTKNTSNSSSKDDENERIFLKWIELTDLSTKRKFCFPVNDYLPSSSGDALELTEVHQDGTCDDNYQKEANKKYSNVENNKREKQMINNQPNDYLQSIYSTMNTSEFDINNGNKLANATTKQLTTTEEKLKYAKLYDIRTKTAHQGFLGIKSLVKANVFVKLYDIHQQTSESIPLTMSRLHQRPFRSNQTDQFQVGTNIKLDSLKKVEMWHDGKKGTRLHCDTLEITDQSNGQIYCFQINEYLENNTKLILTDYDNCRCLDIHLEHQNLSTENTTTYENKEDDASVLSNKAKIGSQSLKATEQKTSSLAVFHSDITSLTSSNVGHKGLLSLTLSGTDAKVYIRMHEGESITDDILLNNSLTHNNAFESGHIDVFEIYVPQYINSPDRIEIFHSGKKHDGLYLTWIEIMNMKTLERKCFPVNRWLDLNEGDNRTHTMLEKFTVNESCEENEYHEHNSHGQYKMEYIIRTKTSMKQPMNNSDVYANIYLKIYNDKNKHTEDMLLNNTKHQTNPFRTGKIDKFEIGSIHSMDDTIDKIELWHDNTSNFDWLCEWIEIKNKKTGSIKCFAVNRLLSRKASDGAIKIVLTIHSHYPCDRIARELHALADEVAIQDRHDYVDKIKYASQRYYHSPNKTEFIKKYIVTTKTGNSILSETNHRVFIRLYDNQNSQSEDILLEQTVTNRIPFQKHALDEFHTGTLNNLLDLQKVHLWHTSERKEEWNVEWLQIEDIDTNRLYCFPVNTWLESNLKDKETHVVLTEFTINQPCSRISNRKDQENLSRLPVTYDRADDDNKNKRKNPLVEFKRSYHVETKTGTKGFLGLSPTGTNAKVFIKIHDTNGQISEAIELEKSISHKNKFERGQTDKFDVGSSQSLDGIDKLELWHDNTGTGHGWFTDYVAVVDNKTGEEACFFIGDYLNKKNGGVEEKHLILDKQAVDNRPCREHNFDATESTIQEAKVTENPTTPFTQTYCVKTKTGTLTHMKNIPNLFFDILCPTAYFGMNGADTNTDVFIRIHDNNAKVSEPLQLKQSRTHQNKFQKNQTDQFDVGTRESLDGIKKLELWLENDKNNQLQLDYVEIIDNKTGHIYCFLVNTILDKNSGTNTTHVSLENPLENVSCSVEFNKSEQVNNPIKTNITHSQKNDKTERNFTIRTKTGNSVEAGSTTPIHIQLFDDRDQKSEDIRLKRKDHDKHNFEPGAIDEFQVASLQSLSNKLIGIRVKHNADKYQGWYAEWIEIIDEDNHQTYCFPIQRWLDKAENDKQTNIYFSDVSYVPCDSILNATPKSGYRSMAIVRKTATSTISSLTSPSRNSDRTLVTSFQNTYHIRTKTRKKGFLNRSPTKTKAKVFVRFIDKNGDVSENLQLHDSTDHQHKFKSGQIDEFDIATSKQLNDIDQLELWTNEKNSSHEWFLEYVQVTDNKTGNVLCFPIDQYLNDKNSGIEENPLKLKRATNEQFCEESIENNNDNELQEQNSSSNVNISNVSSKYKTKFSVIIKTGHTGFSILSPIGAHIPVFIRIHDAKGKLSEEIQLQNSTKHSSEFAKNQTDHFDIQPNGLLEGVSRVELWHESDKFIGWQIEYIQVVDNQTDTSYCFRVNTSRDKNYGSKQIHILLENPLINQSCKKQVETIEPHHSYASVSKKLKPDKSSRNYTIRTKTGNHASAGSTTPIHIQLIDIYDKKSKDIRLKKKDMEGHHFAPDAIDEFKITLPESLFALKAVKLSLDAEKYQGWYGEWISITDDNNQETYCFPIQRWLDKGENDHKTHATLYQQSTIPCDQLSDSILIRSSTVNNEHNEQSRDSEENMSSSDFQVRLKTADISLQNKIGRDANIYLNIYNENNKQIGNSIRLQNSKTHKIPFQRHHTDEFDLTIPIVKINEIDRIDLYHDGQNDGWFCDFVEMKNRQTNETRCFSVHQWLDKVSDDRIKFSMTNYQNVPCDGKRNTKKNLNYEYYTVRIKTNTTNLTLNSFVNVFLKLFGKSHQTEQIQLDKTIDNKQAFQRNNSIDTFEIRTLTQLNSLEKIDFFYEFPSNNRKLSLEWIEITNLSNGTISCFPANCILTSSNINQGIQQVLTLNESNSRPCSN